MCSKICWLLKVFNDTTNTLFDIYYHTTNLFIIECLNIIDAFDDCMSQEPELVLCIQVMKSKELDYYQNISIIYLLRIFFNPCYKLDYLSYYWETCYKCLTLALALSFDISILVRDIR